MRHRIEGVGIVIGAALLAGCSSPSSPCTRSVSPGEGDDTAAVQAMFVAAADGDTLCFSPGTYDISDVLEIRDRADVTIRGTGAGPADTVLDFYAQEAGAKGLSATAMTNVTIENLTAIDAPSDDVYVTGSSGVTLRNLRAGWVRRTGAEAGAYALYPVNSTDVLVEGCEAFGGPDSGIYVGQATRCIVRGNHVHHNVSGIEIENSTSCEVMDNDVEHNTGGILVFELPALPMHGRRTSIHDNRVCDQDTPNFCHPGTTVCGVPMGVGIMLMAANDVEVHGNELCNDPSTGVLVLDYRTADMGPFDPATYDPVPEDICLHDNEYANDGTAPADGPLTFVQALYRMSVMDPDAPCPDIVWDGIGELAADETGTFVNAGAPDFAAPSLERPPYPGTCVPIPAVELEAH